MYTFLTGTVHLLDIFYVLNSELETISKVLALWLPCGHGFPMPELTPSDSPIYVNVTAFLLLFVGACTLIFFGMQSTVSDSPKCFEYNRNI